MQNPKIHPRSGNEQFPCTRLANTAKLVDSRNCSKFIKTLYTRVCKPWKCRNHRIPLGKSMVSGRLVRRSVCLHREQRRAEASAGHICPVKECVWACYSKSKWESRGSWGRRPWIPRKVGKRCTRVMVLHHAWASIWAYYSKSKRALQKCTGDSTKRYYSLSKSSLAEMHETLL